MITAAAWTILSLQSATAPACSDFALDEVACVDTAHGMVLSDDPGLAARYAAVMAEGEARFQRHFGRAPTSYALLLGDRLNPVSDAGLSGSGSAELQERLRHAGVRHILPWFTPEQTMRLARAAQRSGVEAALREQGLDGAALDAAVSERMSALPPPATSAPTKEGAAAHEFGHMWMVAAFWPDHPRRQGDHYGGPASDWFDETAAILLEDESMADDRRRQFREFTSRMDGVGAKPLPAFFTDPHPLASVARTLSSAAALGEGARMVSRLPSGELRTPDGQVLRTEDLPKDAPYLIVRPGDPASNERRGPVTALSVSASSAIGDPELRTAALMFYAQARVLADFLIEASGDPRVHGRIAEALSAGKSMDAWLFEEGEALNLGRSVQELDQLWRAWLATRYPPAG